MMISPLGLQILHKLIGGQEAYAIKVLCERAMTVKDLACRLGIGTQQAAILVKRLLADGLVTTTGGGRDRRVPVVCRLSGFGKKLVKAV